MIEEGDVLYKVDGIVVSGRPLSQLSSVLLGPNGSTSEFTFLRGDAQITVNITRVPFANSLDALV